MADSSEAWPSSSSNNTCFWKGETGRFRRRRIRHLRGRIPEGFWKGSVAPGSQTAPAGIDTLARHGDDVFLVWDADKIESDVILRAGLSLAKALCVRQQKNRDDVEGNWEDIDTAILAVEKEAGRLTSMKIWTETIQSNSGKILDEVRKMADNLEKQVAVLRENVETLRQV